MDTDKEEIKEWEVFKREYNSVLSNFSVDNYTQVMKLWKRLEEKKKKGHSTVMIRDKQMHDVWQISMVIRHQMRDYFDVKYLDHCGYFMDHSLSKIIHEYHYWVAYPSGDQQMRGHTDYINSVVISDDGCYAYSGGRDSWIKVWDLTSLIQLLIHTWNSNHGRIGYMLCKQNRLVSGGEDGSIRIWDAHTFELIRSMQSDDDHSGLIVRINFDRTGQKIISGSDDNIIRLWNMETGVCLRVLKGHCDSVRAIHMIDEQTIVSSSSDSTIRLWKCKKEEEGYVGRVINEHLKQTDSSSFVSNTMNHRQWVTDLRFNCDHTLMVSILFNQSITVFSWPMLSVLRTNPVRTFRGCFHPWIPHWFAFHDRSDHSIKIWDISNGEYIASYSGHSNYVRDLCFSPDCQRLLSVGWDMNVRVWDVSGLYV